MLKLKDNVDLKELEKYGFKILVTDEELEKNMEDDETDYFCTMAQKRIGNHFDLVIENDLYYRQLTFVPDTSFGLHFCLGHQLDIIYDLIQDGLVEKASDGDE